MATVLGQQSDGIYQHLAKSNPNRNLVVSPLSIESVLSLLYMGAEGTTARELQTALRLQSGSKEELVTNYKAKLESLQASREGYTIQVANRIYVNDRLALHPEYNQLVRDSFKAEAEAISLEDSAKAAEGINQWVRDQTYGKINGIVEPDNMTPDLRAVLVNAIYFKGQWQSQFDPKATEVSPFKVTPDERVSVPMMHQTGTFRSHTFHDWSGQVLELPYRNSNLSMLIFLPNEPNEPNGLSKMEEKMAGFSEPLGAGEMLVVLPKFKIEFRTELQESLEQLGVREVFSDQSNLSGLFADGSGGKVSRVTHKAFLEVNEEGAEAAAATGSFSEFPLPHSFLNTFFLLSLAAMVSLRSGFATSFVADHPFAFMIRDHNTVYFQGRVVNPA